jgi:hypothetical protein
MSEVSEILLLPKVLKQNKNKRARKKQNESLMAQQK